LLPGLGLAHRLRGFKEFYLVLKSFREQKPCFSLYKSIACRFARYLIDGERYPIDGERYPIDGKRYPIDGLSTGWGGGWPQNRG
jgi:hypothetical protein